LRTQSQWLEHAQRMAAERELEDVAAALEAIRAAVRRRAGMEGAVDAPADDVALTVALAERARISGHVVLSSDVPVVGPLIVLTQRVIRILLRWYINPIVDQQNNFNDLVVRAIFDLEARQRRLERMLRGAASDSDAVAE